MLSLSEFESKFKEVFDHPDLRGDAARRLLNLHQGSRSVADFSVEFRTLAADTEFNDAALSAAFHKGLSERIKDELVSRDEPSNFSSLVSLAIRLDNRLRERRRERANLLEVSPQRWIPPTRSPVSPGPSVPTTPPEAEQEPMQVGRAHLSLAERLHRRRSGECLYCGGKGHFIASALPPAGCATKDTCTELPDLSAIPSDYHVLREVFRKDLALSLPPHRPYDCEIKLLPDAPLPTSRLYNLSKPERETMESYIRDSLNAGLIRPSSSPVGAGFFFVEKKDKTLRPCIDYRGLNNITVKNRYPLPLINSAFESLQQAKIFTKLDLRNAYHLISTTALEAQSAYLSLVLFPILPLTCLPALSPRGYPAPASLICFLFNKPQYLF
ncbi:hypothetical protein PFLUV_G00052310 [Perca fluviatilis]|uniref:ribonuclease H n=1 Tax=Perca fluviatilis TaxID=8168 RepID=A0A6A5FC13_PERFL|nr:hypothetical protein PFLUV_G00052310 [Perca fluviatilis]